MKKVCHLSSVHHRYDTRVLLKECTSLYNQGYEVHLVVADGKGFEDYNGIQIHDVGESRERLSRFFKTTKAVYEKGLEIDADIYHFHDPELLRIGSRLVKKNKIVIYDSHEDVPRQLRDKAYIPSLLRGPFSLLFEKFEDRVVRRLSGIITATPFIRDRFLESNKNVVEVQNFPFIKEFEEDSTNQQNKEDVVCYVGAISKVRGILNMVDAMKYDNGATLLLGGEFENVELRNSAIKSKGWNNVSELGFLSRDEVKDTLFKSVAGLVVLEPTASYLDSIPVKMFEYMIAGIPVIASDFPYWRVLIEKENCALFVNPQKPEEISKAIKTLIDDQQLASGMGERGKKAVLEKFNWSNEEKKLVDFYERLLKRPSS